MILGFTGTRHGTSDQQHRELCSWLRTLAIDEFHHGCCLGADAEAWEAVSSLAPRAVTHAHPSTYRAMTCESALQLSNVRHAPKDAHARNRAIVDACDLLIACPAEDTEQPFGGTWWTIRYARLRNKRIVIIWPDGSETEEPSRERKAP